MVLVTKVDAVMPGGEHLHACPELGGEIELSGAEHWPIEIEKASTACEKRLDPVGIEEVDLCADGTSPSTVSISALSIRACGSPTTDSGTASAT
jgi:hypothetical protein